MRRTLNISSDDIKKTEAYVTDAYAPVSLRGTADHPQYGVIGSVANFDGVLLEWSKTIGDYEITPLEEFNSVVFNLMTSKTMRYHFRRNQVELAQDFMVAYRSSDKVDCLNNSEHTTVAISNDLLQKRLSLLLDGAGARSVVFSADPVPRNSIKKLCDFVCDLKNSPLLTMDRLMLHRKGAVSDLIVDAFLLFYPNNFSDKLSDPQPMVAPRHVKRAIDYINDHPRRHSTPEALASLSSVSVRSLQYSFKATTGQTISEYQHHLRLQHAREDLLRFPELTITTIAQKWGFGSLGAFGQSFKKAYGMTPSSFIRDSK